MAKNEIWAKVFTNKKTGQKIVMLPKKKLSDIKIKKVKIQW